MTNPTRVSPSEDPEVRPPKRRDAIHPWSHLALVVLTAIIALIGIFWRCG